MSVAVGTWAAPASGGLYTKTLQTAGFTVVTGPSTAYSYWIKWGGDKLVAFSYTHPNLIYTSIDGVNWVRRLQNSTYDGWAPYLGSAGRELRRLKDHWFAVHGNSISVSQDAVTWLNILQLGGGSSNPGLHRAVTVAGSKFVIIEADGFIRTRPWVQYSDTGATRISPISTGWTRSAVKKFTTSTMMMDADSDGSTGVAVSTEGHIYKSIDGENWSRIGVSVLGAVGEKRIRYLNGIWVAWDFAQNKIYYNTNLLGGGAWASNTLNPSSINTLNIIDVDWDGTNYVVGARRNETIDVPFSLSSATINGTFASRPIGTIPSGTSNNYIRSLTTSRAIGADAITEPAPAQVETQPSFAMENTYSTNNLSIYNESFHTYWELDTVNTFDSPNKIVTQGVGGGGDPTSFFKDSPPLTIDGTWYIRSYEQNDFDTDWTKPYTPTITFTLTRYTIPAPTVPTTAAGADLADYYIPLKATLAGPAGIRFLTKWVFTPHDAIDWTSPYRTVLESGSGGYTGTDSQPIIFNPDPDDTLPNRTWDARVYQVDPRDGRVSATYATYSFTQTPGVPATPTTAVINTPGPATQQGTSYPLVSISMPVDTSMSPYYARKIRPQIQFALNNTFTSGAVLFPVGDDFRTAASAFVLFAAQMSTRLSQGHWYMRVRSEDEYGLVSAYGTTYQFDISHPPGAVGAFPPANSVITYSTTQHFTWAFSDTSPGDAQTAYEVQVVRGSDGTVVATTGSVAAADKFADLAISSTYKGQQLTWRVRTTDSDGVVGGWSTPIPFIVADAPTITITSPTNPSNSGKPTVSWTLGGTAGQASFSVTIEEAGTGVTVWTQAGTVSQAVVPNRTILKNLTDYVLTVFVTTTLGTQAVGTLAFTTSYSAPASPVFSADVSIFATDGYIDIDWGPTTPDATFYSWAVYRMDIDFETEWKLLFNTTDQSVRTYHDWTAITNHNYVYAVTQTADRFGVLIESVVIFPDNALSPIEGSWWLIDPDNELNNLRLNVKEDSLTEEIEEAAYVVIGAGRRKEYGTLLGITGTVTASIRPTVELTAAERFRRLMQIRLSRKVVLLKDAFGNSYQVALGNISYNHVPGTGSTEMYDVSIPVDEVYAATTRFSNPASGFLLALDEG